jgi:DNA-binding Lrp family transcriptional regulator
MNNTFEFRLLNEFQRDFPLCSAPFAELASRLGVAERVVLGSLEKLKREGKISRVGAVFAPKRIGASTLAAMAVPPEQLVLSPLRSAALPRLITITSASIATTCGLSSQHPVKVVCRLPWGQLKKPPVIRCWPCLLEEEFHIDLGFGLHAGATKRVAASRPVLPAVPIDESGRRLVSVLQEGLPLFMRPFALIAERIGASESDVLGRIRRWLDDGAIKRFGVVVRHQELGYTANAMVVQDLPDDRVSEIGRILAEEQDVTLCYRRPRRLAGLALQPVLHDTWT